jgi:hypothetical protein
MGRAIGIVGAFMAGIRVAGELTYIPAHIKNGKQISARIQIPVYRNSNRGTNQRTGEKGRVDSFKLVAWGKLADVCARSLPKGTAIDVFAEPQSYLGTLFNQDGSPRLDNAGQVIQTTKVSFTILSIVFGEDSEKHIAGEIAAGRRPQFWNVPNHQDYQSWKSILQAKQQLTWDGTNRFGYARVVIPQGAGIQLDMSVYQPKGAPAAGYPGAQMVNGAGGMPGMVAQVANAFQPQPGPANPMYPNAGNPNVQMPVNPNGGPMQQVWPQNGQFVNANAAPQPGAGNANMQTLY